MYSPSIFNIGDHVETTEEYKRDIEAHIYNRDIQSYQKGHVEDILTVIETDTKEPIYDILLLDNGFSSSVRYFQKVA